MSNLSSKKNTFKKAWRKTRKKMWWLDVLTPLLLSASLIFALSFQIYSGQKHRKISSSLEKFLLKSSLQVAQTRTPVLKDKIITISIENNYPSTATKDSTISSYALTLQKTINLGAKYIVISFTPRLHTKKESYSPLVEVMKKAPKNIKVILAVPYEQFSYLPAEIKKSFHVLDSDPCQGQIQIMCDYNKKWDDWVIQAIPDDLWKKETSKTYAISSNLPLLNKSYLLYLNNPDDFTHYTSSNLPRLSSLEKPFKDKKVFIGTPLSHNKEVRVQTLFSAPGNKYTPYHVYWAQIAQLFMDDALIKIVPKEGSIAFTVLFTLLILALLIKINALVALISFLLFTFLAPFLNALFIQYFGFYLPIFDAIYAGLSSLLFAVFAKLSFYAFHHWWLSAKQAQEQETLDIKANFLSLISHNLNTPVAKMQGMLDLLTSIAKSPVTQENAREANTLVAQIQLAIRSILVTNAVEEFTETNDIMTFNAVVKEFKNTMQRPLKRLGLDVQIHHDPYDDLSNLPLMIDKRIMTTMLAAMSGIFFDDENIECKINIYGAIEETKTLDDNKKNKLRLSIIVSSPSCWLSAKTEKEITSQLHIRSKSIDKSRLMVSLFTRLLILSMKRHNGQIKISEDPDTEEKEIIVNWLILQPPD